MTGFGKSHRGDDKFIVRMPAGMRDAIKARSKINRRSMNFEVLSMINAALNANGPAEAATSPDRGSTNPQKDKEMNERNFSTGDAFSASHGLHPHFAMAKDIVAECRQGSTGNVDYELDKLILRFTEAAQTIDPRIEAVWVGRDGDQFKTPFMIHMVRRAV